MPTVHDATPHISTSVTNSSLSGSHRVSLSGIIMLDMAAGSPAPHSPSHVQHWFRAQQRGAGSCVRGVSGLPTLLIAPVIGNCQGRDRTYQVSLQSRLVSGWQQYVSPTAFGASLG